MALTVANVNSRAADVFGRHKVAAVTVTFDSSYATGGESFAPANVGLSEFDIVLISEDSAAGPGYQVKFNYTTKKLQVFEEEAVAAGGPLLEAANATDLSALKVRVLAIGA